MRRSVVGLIFALFCIAANAQFVVVEADRVVSGLSKFPIAVAPERVGRFPAMVKSGAGYFYDEVLEYRVWLHPERGAAPKNGGNDYFVAFAQYERALEYSKRFPGAESPLVLIRQLEHVNEPKPGVFEVIRGERVAEWRVEWLEGSKRVPGAIEKFMAGRKR